MPSPKSQHPNVIYCSERCSRPTVAEFEAHQAEVAAHNAFPALLLAARNALRLEQDVRDAQLKQVNTALLGVWRLHAKTHSQPEADRAVVEYLQLRKAELETENARAAQEMAKEQENGIHN